MLRLAAVLAFFALPAVAQEFPGNPEEGANQIRKCLPCHSVGDGGLNKLGPHLDGVVGRPVASLETFAYSVALSEAATSLKAWTPENLAAWLRDPRTAVVGSKMSFVGEKDKQDLYDIIAYLATIPAPAPAP